jgi:hypothetical protein
VRAEIIVADQGAPGRLLKEAILCQRRGADGGDGQGDGKGAKDNVPPA